MKRTRISTGGSSNSDDLGYAVARKKSKHRAADREEEEDEGTSEMDISQCLVPSQIESQDEQAALLKSEKVLVSDMEVQHC